MEKTKPKAVAKSKDGLAVLYDNGTIKILHVRLSYEHIFKKWAGKNADGSPQKEKYSATFILPLKTHKEAILFLRDHARKLAKESPKIKTLLADDKLFVKKGDPAKEEYQNAWIVKASEDKRPQIVDKDARTPITEDDDKIFSGVWVNALIRPWPQANAFGKRINANLLTVQFDKTDERFGEGGRPAAEDVFDDTSEEGDDFNEGDDDDLGL